MAVNLSPYGGVGAQFLDNAGNVLTGGRIETYAAGTTTPQATYTSSLGVTFHPNPIILDASGRVPSGGEIWLTDGLQYKFVLRDSANVLIATYDNISGINSNFVNFTSEQEIQTATAGQTVFTLATTNYTPGTNSLSVFVDGVNQYGPGAQYAYLETNSTTITFVNGLHVGASVKFTTAAALTGTATNANVVVYDPAGAGAVSTTVQAKLRETVSVKDFGAVGNGVTDDTVAIQAAVTYAGSQPNGGQVVFPSGTYLVSGQVLTPSNVHIYGQYNAVININPLNWTGGITRFYALFTTVNVTARPEVGNWRIGTGVPTYFNIIIENLTVNVNRDGNVLTPAEMAVSEFNVVRFEDSVNCVIKNCRMIDEMTQANHHPYTMMVFFVRSQRCGIVDSRFERCSSLFIAESEQCYFNNNYSIYGNSSPVECIGGARHDISYNYFGEYWETTSCVGINSTYCTINNNEFVDPTLMAVVLGHDDPPIPSQYFAPIEADYSICNHNKIVCSGSTNFGIFVQNGANLTISENVILGLGKAAAFNTDDKIGIRVSGTGAVARFLNNTYTANTIDDATAGIRISDGDSITISDNTITDTLAAIFIAGSVGYEALIEGNYIDGAESAILSFGGFCRAVYNRIYNITANGPSQYSIRMQGGGQQFSHNSIGGIGECIMFDFTIAEIINNTFTNSPVVSGDLWTLNNDDGAGPKPGTANAFQILIAGNKNDAFTNFVRTFRVIDYGTKNLQQNMVTTIPGELVFDPGSIASGSGETSSAISIIGAALGNPVIVAAPYDLQGMTATAYVDSTNSVRIRVDNNTGGAIDLASGTWKVWVLKT
jgi:parallel beta-helix repeat protein